jgi:hypothetical protein
MDFGALWHSAEMFDRIGGWEEAEKFHELLAKKVLPEAQRHEPHAPRRGLKPQ